MQQLTIQNLTHPTMIAKIKLAMKLTSSGRGDEMNGFGTRCYIQNEHGRNIMRLQYNRGTGFTVYGNESVNITKVVAAAIKATSKIQRV